MSLSLPGPEAMSCPPLAFPPRLALELAGSRNERRGGPLNGTGPARGPPCDHETPSMTRICGLVSAGLLGLLIVQPGAAAEPREAKRVLVLYTSLGAAITRKGRDHM